MQRPYLIPFLGSLALTFIVGFGLPTLKGEVSASEPSVWKWLFAMPSGSGLIFNYQTLLTGILSVGAAFWTVRQMRLSDQLTRELALRPAVTAVKRALVPQYGELLAAKAFLANLTEVLARPHRGSAVLQNAYQLEKLANAIVEPIERPHFREGMRYMDGETATRLDELIGTATRLIEKSNRMRLLSEAADMDANEAYYLDLYLEGDHDSMGADELVPRDLLRMGHQLIAVLKGLEETAREYGLSASLK